MTEFVEKYMAPFTYYGFYKLFAEEPNKDLLLDFLNELLKAEQGQIKNISYLKTEQLGNLTDDRKAIFDIYCENEKGEKFIVELQKARHDFYKERSAYYSTFPNTKKHIYEARIFTFRWLQSYTLLSGNFKTSYKHFKFT